MFVGELLVASPPGLVFPRAAAALELDIYVYASSQGRVVESGEGSLCVPIARDSIKAGVHE